MRFRLREDDGVEWNEFAVDPLRARRKARTSRFLSFTVPAMEKSSYVYMLASSRYCTLYIGVTSDLIKRVWQHREAVVEGFTKRYGVKRLVWYEIHADMSVAIAREKQLKKWNRAWKMELVRENNPLWLDLYEDFTA